MTWRTPSHYLRLLDAAAEKADWREAATLVLGLDCDAAPIMPGTSTPRIWNARAG